MTLTPGALDRLADEHSFSGVVSVDAAGERKLSGAYGFAHRAHRVPMSMDTRIGVASMSKAFTALAVMSLVDEGVMPLDMQARSLLRDDLPLIDDRVTVEHLLSHTSGIGDYLDESGDGDIADYVLTTPVHQLAETEAFLAELDGRPQVSAPGETFAYCNGGYIVLALLIERATGAGFHDIVAERVFRPAGLTATAYDRSDALPAGTALGYLDSEGDGTNVFHLPIRGNGDGGAYTTARDLSAFWNALLDGAIIERSTVARMLEPRSAVPDEGMRYGLGFWLHETSDAVILEGYDAGVSCRSTFEPATRRTTTVLANTSEGAWPMIGALESLA